MFVSQNETMFVYGNCMRISNTLLIFPAAFVAFKIFVQEAIFVRTDVRMAVAGKDLFSYLIRFRIFHTSRLTIWNIVFKYIRIRLSVVSKPSITCFRSS